MNSSRRKCYLFDVNYLSLSRGSIGKRYTVNHVQTILTSYQSTSSILCDAAAMQGKNEFATNEASVDDRNEGTDIVY